MEEQKKSDVVTLEENSFASFSEAEVVIGITGGPQFSLKWKEAQRLAVEILRRPGEWWLGDRVGTEWKPKDGKCWPGCPRLLIGGRCCAVLGVAVWEGDPCHVHEALQKAVRLNELRNIAAKVEYAAEKSGAEEHSRIDLTKGDAAFLLNEVLPVLKGPDGLPSP